MMTKEEIKALPLNELEKEIGKSKQDLLKLKIQTGTGQSKETSKISVLRKMIAQMQTAKTALIKSQSAK
jgi:ribosomal protein L29